MSRHIPVLPFVLSLALLCQAPARAQEPTDPAARSQGLTLYFYRAGDPVAVPRAGVLSGDVEQNAAQLLIPQIAPLSKPAEGLPRTAKWGIMHAGGSDVFNRVSRDTA